MIKQISLLIFSLLLSISLYPQFSAGGGGGTPYEYKPGVTDVQTVYIFESLSGAYLEYTSSSSSVSFKKYTYSADDQIDVPDSDIDILGNTYRINNLEDGKGYIANGKDKVWVIDYSKHRATVEDITFDTENLSACDGVRLRFNGNIPSLIFYNQKAEYKIPREYTLSYDNLKYNDANGVFDDSVYSDKINITSGEYVLVKKLLKDTYFSISGDQFAEHFGLQQTATSKDTYKAVAVETYIKGYLVVDGMELADSTSTSAPVTMRFYGIANEPTASKFEWSIYYNGDMQNWEARYYDMDITYTFSKAGKYSIELIVTNSDSDKPCEAVDEYELSDIAESMLKIPNFFSPDASPGVNDVFKVKHKSLVKFKAVIFNRWGNRLYEWNDPDGGWDGKYGGKYVNPGVYFYVIEATGADGKKYKEGGDINILRSK